MKYIICDFATSNWGKTKTLLKVIEILKTKVKPTIEEQIGEDKFAVFDINKKKIAINTQGDPNSYLEEGLERAIDMNADIIICASRTKGATISYIYNHAKNGYEIVWFSNFHADDVNFTNTSLLNDLTAESIVKLLFELK